MINTLKFALSALLLVTLLFLASCGEHGLLDEIFGEVSSSSDGLSGGLSSSGSSSSSNDDDVAIPPDDEGDGVVIIPNDDELDSLAKETPNSNGVVEPLTKTKWGQWLPYNSMFPIGNDGMPVIAGCGNIAWSQMLAFHKYPARGKGESGPTKVRSISVPSVNFEVDYDWGNILNSYRSDGKDSDERQWNAVATFIYHVAAARDGGQDDHETLVKVFGYDKSIQRRYRVYYTDAEWEAIIKQQLDAGLPVYYWGNEPGSDHAFIVDGYDNVGKFHINWGWAGSRDGWFSLNNFDYGDGRHFYNNQRIAINIKPDAGGAVAPWEMALNTFTANKTTVSQNELFTTSFALRNVAVLNAFPGGQAGIALVNNSGRIVEVIGIINYNALNASSSRTSTINSFVPETINPGQYSLRIVTRPTNGEWKFVELSAIGDGVSNSIPFNVTPMETNSGGYGMALTAFTTTKTTVSQNELFSVSSALRNVALVTFPGGQVGTALADNNGDIKAIIGSRTTGARNPGTTSSVGEASSYVPSTVAPGKYKLGIAVKQDGSEEWRIATMSVNDTPTSIDFTVTPAEKGALGGGYGLALTSFTTDNAVMSQSELINAFVTSRTTVSQNERFIVSSALRNVAMDAFPGGQVGTALVDNNGNIKAIIGSRTTGARNPGTTSSVGTAASYVPETVAPGQYKLKIAVRPTDNDEWRIANMAVGETPNAIPITVTPYSSTSGSSYSYLKTEAIYVPETRIQNIAEYQVEVKSYTFTEKNGKTLEVYYTFPKPNEGNAKILFTLHGSGEPAAGFIDIYKYISETENIIVIAPDFVAQFPGTSQYNELGIASNINNPENWASKIIDEIFLDFKGRFGLSNDKYILYGFSAGGQFTHRATMFSESPYMDYSISAAPGGWMTFPEDKAYYPYGIKNLPMYKDLMNRNFGRKMYLLSGNRDSITFDSRPDASFQGSSRHDRELNFYQTSKDYCKQNGLFFNIDLIVMDRMGHSNSGPRPYVIDIVKGIYDSREKNAQ